MNKTSYFSIITPCYKGQQYINKLLQIAADNQEALQKNDEDCHVELILVNDSPDDPLKVEIPPKNVNVKLLTHSENAGIHQARVTGLNAAKGEYILFLDQDDEISKDCIYKEYNCLKAKNADVVIANCYVEGSDGTKSLLYKTRGQFKNALELGPYIKAHDQIISPGHCLIRREAIPDEWKTNILRVNGSDDLFLWILMFLKGCSFISLEDPVYVHKYTGSNLSTEGSKMAESSIEVSKILKTIPYVPKELIYDFVRNRKLKIEFADSNLAKKIILILRNMDVLLPRIWWRVRGITVK